MQIITGQFLFISWFLLRLVVAAVYIVRSRATGAGVFFSDDSDRMRNRMQWNVGSSWYMYIFLCVYGVCFFVFQLLFFDRWDVFTVWLDMMDWLNCDLRRSTS